MIGFAFFIALLVIALLWCAHGAHMAATNAVWRERWGPPRRSAWTPIGEDMPLSGPVDIGGGAVGAPPVQTRRGHCGHQPNPGVGDPPTPPPTTGSAAKPLRTLVIGVAGVFLTDDPDPQWGKETRPWKPRV